MRQDTNDYRVNPFEHARIEFIGDSSADYKQSVHHQLFVKNKINSKALNFCQKACPATNGWTKEQEECANTCVNKFKTALTLFKNENNAFIKTMEDVGLNGGDIYKARDI